MSSSGVFFFYKRIMDFVVSLFLVIVFSPIILIVALLLLTMMKTSPFFIQKRPGRNERIFSLYKFKTMTDEVGTNGELLDDEKRLTRIGGFIRSTSLDELPQLLNVLNGDMSLVGPRPLLVRYLTRYNEQQRKRHNVRPGITGLAQVKGRNSLSWQEKFMYDNYYVENASVLLDLQIIMLTVKKVLFRQGISSDNHTTMEEFYNE